jgi:exodeoxyribonuclease V beta subunit
MSGRATEYFRLSILDDLPAAGHAIIEASAGTGKTYAIEHLVLELLRTTAKTIGEILVVTFTEKATAELRARIRAAIENILRAPSLGDCLPKAGHALAPIDESACLRLEHALAKFELAPIFTIHAFCNRVLTEFAFHSGSRFSLDLVDGRRAFRTTFRALLRERFAVDPLMHLALTQWLQGKSADDLEDHLYQSHRKRYQVIDHAVAIGQVERAIAARQPIGLQSLTDLYLPPLEERLNRDKHQHGQIDYDDMLAWVWDALEGPSGAALTAILRQRFRFGLVDEFQDTDDLQWQIFRRIFVESGGGNRLFVVGDPKQAIYAFRGADVHSYMRARSELLEGGAPRIPIDHNFRSTAPLIDACNYILDQKASKPLFSGTIVYDRPVKCGAPHRSARDGRRQPIVPITLMRYSPPDGEKGSAEDSRKQLGRFIALTIKRIIAGPTTNLCDAIILDEPAGTEGVKSSRKVGAGGIFVLASSKKECLEIGKYLREAGVPFAFYKLEGLFQTPEAMDVLDVLRALQDVNDRSRRRRAWMSPFFALEYREVATIDHPPPSHPLNQLLDEWCTLAESERFAELFNRLMHQSGLADRELFLHHDERELTNYSHIFEVLLERAVAGRLGLTEIVELLDDYVREHAEPPGPNGNLQRLESEREAVQVMTIHMSKGLEADVVMLFGGTHGNNQPALLQIYHEGYDRRFTIGSGAPTEVKEAIDRERSEEHQRLIYVAMTRARAKLYLPFYPARSIRKGNGYYTQLNERLREVIKTMSEARDNQRWTELFEIADPRESNTPPAARPETIPIEQWMPPSELLADCPTPEIVFDRLITEHAPFRMSSYTSLKRATAAWDIAPEDFKTDIAPTVESDDLPGGSDVGLFLHEVIERLDFDSFTTADNLESWRRLENVERLFRDSMRRHQVRDPRWFDRGTEMVFRALTSPIAIAGGRTIGALNRSRNTREMEFLFPIPEAVHPRLGANTAEGWIAERGYLKGFIDLVFEDNGLTYFADWKSDLLPDYRAETIQDHIKRNYELQAQIYSVGVIRLLRIRSEADYRRRFGGLLYIFLRGVGADADRSHGIYFHRPDWSEIRRHESYLMRLGARA